MGNGIRRFSTKQKFQMTNIKQKKAFSLIELSIVLLIIGIVIAGITQSTRLIAQFRLSTARSLTQSSPVPSVKDLVTWIEASSVSSFADSETENGTDITTWYDLNPSTSSKINATGGGSTTTGKYTTNCMNGVPCVRFGGDDYFTFSTLPAIIASDYTIFVVEQKTVSGASAGHFVGGSQSGAGARLTLGHASDTVVAFNTGVAVATTGATDNRVATISAFTSATPVIHTFINNNGTGIYYLNNKGTTVTGTNQTTTPLTTSFTSLQLGRTNIAASGTTNATYYTGDIGEIIMFSRALKNEERQAIMDYLAKKWRVTITNS